MPAVISSPAPVAMSLVPPVVPSTPLATSAAGVAAMETAQPDDGPSDERGDERREQRHVAADAALGHAPLVDRASSAYARLPPPPALSSSARATDAAHGADAEVEADVDVDADAEEILMRGEEDEEEEEEETASSCPPSSESSAHGGSHFAPSASAVDLASASSAAAACEGGLPCTPPAVSNQSSRVSAATPPSTGGSRRSPFRLTSTELARAACAEPATSLAFVASTGGLSARLVSLGGGVALAWKQRLQTSRPLPLPERHRATHLAVATRRRGGSLIAIASAHASDRAVPRGITVMTLASSPTGEMPVLALARLPFGCPCETSRLAPDCH